MVKQKERKNESYVCMCVWEREEEEVEEGGRGKDLKCLKTKAGKK